MYSLQPVSISMFFVPAALPLQLFNCFPCNPRPQSLWSSPQIRNNVMVPVSSHLACCWVRLSVSGWWCASRQWVMVFWTILIWSSLITCWVTVISWGTASLCRSEAFGSRHCGRKAHFCLHVTSLDVALFDNRTRHTVCSNLPWRMSSDLFSMLRVLFYSSVWEEVELCR